MIPGSQRLLHGRQVDDGPQRPLGVVGVHNYLVGGSAAHTLIHDRVITVGPVEPNGMHVTTAFSGPVARDNIDVEGA